MSSGSDGVRERQLLSLIRICGSFGVLQSDEVTLGAVKVVVEDFETCFKEEITFHALGASLACKDGSCPQELSNQH